MSNIIKVGGGAGLRPSSGYSLVAIPQAAAIEATTSLNQGTNLWRVPAEVTSESAIITGINLGINLYNLDISSPAKIGAFDASFYNTGGSCWQIVSVASGETITILQGSQVRYGTLYVRHIYIGKISATKLGFMIIYNTTTTETTQLVNSSEVTVSPNFFASGIKLKNYIGLGFSASETGKYYSNFKAERGLIY